MAQRLRLRKGIAILVAFGALGALSACFSSSDDRIPQLHKSLGELRLAVEAAQSAETKRHAPSELFVAADKLAECRYALDRNDVVLAERLLAQAEVNLVLARAKVDAARAKARLEEATITAPASPADPSRGSRPPAP